MFTTGSIARCRAGSIFVGCANNDASATTINIAFDHPRHIADEYIWITGASFLTLVGRGVIHDSPILL